MGVTRHYTPDIHRDRSMYICVMAAISILTHAFVCIITTHVGHVFTWGVKYYLVSVHIARKCPTPPYVEHAPFLCT